MLLALLLSASLVEGKVQRGVVGIGGPGGERNRWQYLSKFGYGLGEGQYEVRLRLKTPRSIDHDAQLLSLHLYLDEDWKRVESLPACGRIGEDLSRATYDVEIRRSGEWSDWHDGFLTQRVRPHIWYFALSNCRNLMNNYETVEVEFELRARQEGGSQFGVEAQYMLGVHCLAMVLLSVFLVDYAARCLTFKKTNLAIHPVIWVLTGALALQYIAQALHAWHLWRYRSDGVGEQTLDMLSENMLMASQVVHTTLLIVIAQGYTLLQSKSDDPQAMKLIATAVLLVHAALVWFGKLEDDASYKTHQNEGLIGWSILGMRMILLCWFMHSARCTQHATGMRQAAFLQRFRAAGAVYFLAYPAIFLVVQALAPYLRHPVMQVGVLVMQLASDFWLAGLFLSRGAYFEVSTLSCSILPDPRTPIRQERTRAEGSPCSLRVFSMDGSPASRRSSVPHGCSPSSSSELGSSARTPASTTSSRQRLIWADGRGEALSESL